MSSPSAQTQSPQLKTFWRRFWMSFQFTHLPADEGCEACEGIVLLLIFTA